MSLHHNNQPYALAGLFTLSLRLVIGWTYFSAFWRRLILADKLDPDAAGYIGEKFNHFLPNALGIKPMIEYLVTHPDALWWAMAVFTIVEAIVGLFIMLGLFTRLMSIGVFLLALGILLGSGWIGTTCLDEWQIGVLGIAGGFTLFLTGSSFYSLDYLLLKKKNAITRLRFFFFICSGNLPIKQVKPLVLFGSLAIFFLTLFTNQYFHGGVYGTLHNKSVKPKIEISNAVVKNDRLQFRVYRTEGADVYGSFLIGIQLLDEQGAILAERKGDDLAAFFNGAIHNHYVAKVKPGVHSLVIPLGAKADIQMHVPVAITEGKQKLQLKLIDISGAEWQTDVLMEG